MFKRTIVSTLIATTVAVGAIASSVQPSAAGPHPHHHHNHGGLALGLGLGGFLLGSALAQPRVVVVDQYGGSGHVQRCLYRYKSYDPASDTYLGYDGYRHYCQL